MSDGVCLPGLDGSNPLAFLAALGVLRSLTLDAQARARASGLDDDTPADQVRMWWTRERGAWTPWIDGPGLDQPGIIQSLARSLPLHANHPTLNLGDNFACTPHDFREHAHALNLAGLATDLLAALGSDAALDDKGLCLDTALRTMRGAGHQHFLKTMRSALSATNPPHLERALLNRWDYLDPMRGLSLRLDPLDDRRYAHQWVDPSGDPSRALRGSMTAATALAALGLSLLTVAPIAGSTRTLGFRSSRPLGVQWTWPIWSRPIPLDVARSTLALDHLQHDSPHRPTLARLGIVEVFRSTRITNGKFRNFAPAVSV